MLGMDFTSVEILLHLLIGVLFTATGFTVRSTCQHRGWLPHPGQQIPIILALGYLESVLAVNLVG